MNYEVELKFRIADPSAVTTWLAGHGATPAALVEQRDTYFNHPSRNFAETDEAFRIRTVGDANRLTYKGPLLDQLTKTRQELEVACEPGPAGHDKLRQLLLALSFREVITVVKQRTAWHLDWQGRPFEAAVDEVGRLGTFLELETIAAGDDWESARDMLLQLATTMGLHDSERRSYLQLLLEGTET